MLRRSNGNTRLATTTTRAAAGACLITFFLLLSLQWTKLISASPPSLTNKLTQLKQQQRSEYQVDDSWEEQPKAAAQHARLDDYDTSLTTNDDDDDDDQANQDYQDDLDVPYEQLKDKLHQQHEQQLKQHSLDQDAFEWDVLVFTQQWPVTTCYHWREEDKNHECKLPSKKEFWTIHGIWPTKIGHFGPNFCNKTADFDLDKLQRILAELQQFWPDIDGEDKNNQNWLWKHEWLKHGTCAALLAQLDNELKYFEQALDWREDYLISNMLGAANIHPDSNNTVVALQTALFKALGHNPSIHCLYDIKNDVSYLAEIRICFNKLLKLTDCDGVKLGDAVRIDYPGGNVITNCHISKPVHYPSLVPAWQRKQNEKWKFPIVNMYKLLRFIMWLTL